MLHDLLRRLETLQEEMNTIREELVSTIKESFDLEALKLDEDKIAPLKFGDDSEEEQEEETEVDEATKPVRREDGPLTPEEMAMIRKAAEKIPEAERKMIEQLLAQEKAKGEVKNETTQDDLEENPNAALADDEEEDDEEGEEEEEEQDEETADPLEFGDDSEEQEEDSAGAPDANIEKALRKGEKGGPPELGDVGDNEEEQEEEKDRDAGDENTDASAAVNDYNAEEETEDDEEDGEDDEEESDEVDEEVEEGEEKKNNEAPSTFDKLKSGDKFKLPKIEQTFVKVSQKEYAPDNADPKIQQKNKSVIINPQSKVISVPKADEIKPSPTKSPASTPGDSKEPVNAGTQTSQDTKVATSQKAAKPVKPQLEEAEPGKKEKKQVVDLTGRAAEAGTTKGDVDPDQLAKGKKIEMEHTKDSKLAEKIALDHLTEFPDYYDRLERMEREAKAAGSEAPAEKEEPEAEEPAEEPEAEVPAEEPEADADQKAPTKDDQEEPEAEKEPVEKQEKKQLRESTLDNLVNTMIVSALENIEKAKK